MKKESVLESFKEMIDKLETDYPLFGDIKRDDEFYKKLRTFRSAINIISSQETNLCTDCGEKVVCPKCTPVIERTNSIIIRHKDTDYNGGYPNVLVITPMYTNSTRSVSIATITGDNFFHPRNKTAGYTYMERGTMENTAYILANSDIETWCRLFGFPKNRMKAAKDIKELLRQYLGLGIN